MIFDIENFTMVGIFAYPDWVFVDVPRQPETIKETVVVAGSSSNSMSIGGTTDQ